MALRTLILARSPREGGNYARRAGLKRWTFRTVYSARQIKGLPTKGVEVHILPSFATMANRGSVLGALRWRKGIEFFYVDPADLPTLSEVRAAEQASSLGDLTDDHLEAAYAENDEFPHEEWAAQRRRDLVARMSDEDLAQFLAGSSPETAVKVIRAAAPKRTRKPAAPAAAPADFFGSV